MKYKKFIENNFLIDRPDTGELVPFVFNTVQSKYYQELCDVYDIENLGLTSPIRENILKARREGFSSLILAIFCADDIYNDNPTETLVLSYKSDATAVFLKRYRTYALSYFALQAGVTVDAIKAQPGILDEVAKQVFTVDSNDIEFAHNKAHFTCGTASARVGGRGGVLQKLLFSEVAYYPDTELMTAKEIIEGTMRQVDISSGWVFCESTENGRGTYQHRLWQNAKLGTSRFKNRFYGAGDFYNAEQLAQIKSEFVDMDMFRREYPMSEDDLFTSSMLSFVREDELKELIEYKESKKQIVFWLTLQGTNYIDQCEIIASALEQLAKKYPHNDLYGGIDIAKQHDKTVLTLILNKAYSINGGIKALAMDSTGIGDFMPDWFEKNTRYYLIRVKFSRMMKDIMYTNLTAVIKNRDTALPLLMEDGEYTSPEAKMFWDEMTELEKKIIGSMIVVSHPNGDDAHDDMPDSWCLAEHAYVAINGVNKRDKPEPNMTMTNSLETMLNRKGGKRVVDTEYD